MINKKAFGVFVREKRLEKGLTQKEFAEQLFITESAVSKWELGKSYPDITMIADICKVLDVSEHELVAGATDTEYRSMKKDALLYRRLSEGYFWGFTIAYLITMAICLISDLAIHHRLTFSVVVFGSLMLAYAFVPSWIRFTKEHKLAVFSGTSYLSFVLLFLICCVRFHQNWFGIATTAVLFSYVLCFGIPLLRRYLPEKSRKDIPLIYFISAEFCLLLLLCVVRITIPYDLKAGILISLYSCIPFVLTALIHMTGRDRFIKTAIDVLVSGLTFYGLPFILEHVLHEGPQHYYRVDFTDWKNCTNGNVSLIVAIASVLIFSAFIIIGSRRNRHIREQ